MPSSFHSRAVGVDGSAGLDQQRRLLPYSLTRCCYFRSGHKSEVNLCFRRDWTSTRSLSHVLSSLLSSCETGKSRPKELYHAAYRRAICRKAVLQRPRGARARNIPCYGPTAGETWKGVFCLRVHGDQGPGFRTTLTQRRSTMDPMHKYTYKCQRRATLPSHTDTSQ